MAANPDFKDLFSALIDANARYLVVGAYAVIHYTEPRYTKDLDIWTDTESDNPERVMRALAAFGAPVDQITITDLGDPEMVFQIGIEPNRIDVLLGLGELRFADAWARATQASYDGVPIRILSLEDLLIAKRTAARPQDLLDVSRLEEARKRKK